MHELNSCAANSNVELGRVELYNLIAKLKRYGARRLLGRHLGLVAALDKGLVRRNEMLKVLGGDVFRLRQLRNLQFGLALLGHPAGDCTVRTGAESFHASAFLHDHQVEAARGDDFDDWAAFQVPDLLLAGDVRVGEVHTPKIRAK
jgi:hypothetical protein